MNIPSSERSKDTKGTTSSQEASVGTTSAAVLQVCEAEEQECQVKRKEEGEESDGRAESADQQQEGEDEPAHEIESERVEEWVWGVCFQCRRNLEAARCQNDGCANPEAAVRS
jgi:hypothetical protein